MGAFGIAALVMKFPRLASFLKRFGKWIAIAMAIAGAVWWFTSWKADLIATADKAGFDRAAAQCAAAVKVANDREQVIQNNLNRITDRFGTLATTREQQVIIDTQPRIERIIREVASNPRYRECSVSSGMLDELNAARSSVNARISASAPDAAR